MMRPWSRVLSNLLVTGAAAALATTASAQMLPISATGWTHDIVVESGVGTPYNLAASAFDVPNNWAWYEQGLLGSTKGLPAGGLFASVTDALVIGQFQPYNAPNAVLLNAGTPSGTITLAPAAQVAYSSLAVFASSANGGGTGTLVITFTDSSTSAAINYNAQDWFNVTTNNALNNRGRVNLTTNAVDDASASNPRIYHTTINLAALGLSSLPIQSITFNKPATSNTTAIFGVSGQRAITAATPVAATGWNRDIVVENTAVVPYSDYASSFDTFNNIAWYENGLLGSTKGLPAGGAFLSVSNTSISAQLQPYNQPNALFLDAGAPTGTLTFDTASRRPYEFLAIIASSSNMGGLGSFFITFTDATTTPVLPFNAQDWFNVTTNNALNNLGRQGLASATTDDGSAGNPRMYQTVVDLVALGFSDRAVDSITFTKPNVGGAAQNTAVMAISGQAVAGVTGACTFPDGTCGLLPAANCTGTYGGDNSVCPPTGACIATDGSCTIRYQANCAFVSGNYLGDGASCPAPGACIATATGNCTQLNSFQCALANGNFLGAGTPCPAPGACCTATACVVLNSFQCAVAGGNFQGPGTPCAYTYPGGIVPSTELLEDISGTGAEVAWTTGTIDDGFASIAIGFDFPFYSNTYSSAFVGTNGLLTFGAGSTAFTNACPVPAAAAPNNAIYPSWDDFHIGSATFLHPGRVYTETRTSPNRFIVQWNRVGQYNAGQIPTDENTFQVILYENGNIDIRYGLISAQVACDATIGIENSAGTEGLNYDNLLVGFGDTALSIAAQSPCPTATEGACCCGSTCFVAAPGDCTGAGRSFAGSGSACTPFSFTAPCCRGDYNKNTSGPPISVQDIFDFLTGYFGNDACANTNDSGGANNGISVQDIFDFLSAYFGGGC